MLVLVIADIIAIAGTMILAFPRLLGNEPLVFWLVIATVVLSGILVLFSYFAFRDVAEERNKYKDEVEELKKQVTVRTEQSLILTPRTYRIGLSGMSGMAKCPDKPDGAYWLCLDVSTNAVNKAIDTLDLIIEGKPIHANQWDRKIATSFTVCFSVTDWKGKGIIQVDLRAHIEGDGYSIVRRPIDFDIQPGGFPRYF